MISVARNPPRHSTQPLQLSLPSRRNTRSHFVSKSQQVDRHPNLAASRRTEQPRRDLRRCPCDHRTCRGGTLGAPLPTRANGQDAAPREDHNAAVMDAAVMLAVVYGTSASRAMDGETADRGAAQRPAAAARPGPRKRIAGKRPIKAFLTPGVV